MKTKILILILILTTFQKAYCFKLPWLSKSDFTTCKVIKVKDGDTIQVFINSYPKNLQKTSIRLARIDAPEMGGKAECDDEKQLAIKSKAFLEELISKTDEIQFKAIGYEKYGRILAEVYSKKINRHLAKHRFAVDVARKKVATTPFGGSCAKDNSDFRKRSNLSDALLEAGLATEYQSHSLKNHWCNKL